MNWQETPLVRIFLPFVSGILLAIHLRTEIPTAALFFSLLLILPGLALTLRHRLTFHYRWLPGAWLSMTLLVTGLGLAQLHDERLAQGHFRTSLSGETAVSGRVEQVNHKGDRLQLILKTRFIRTDSTPYRSCRGRLLVYLDADDRSRQLSPGDRLWLRGRIFPTPPLLNPQAFDYGRWLHFRNLHYQCFVREGQWRSLPGHHRRHIGALADRLRQYGLEVLRRRLPGAHEFAVGSALILGYKDELTDDVRQAYAGTGAMHVLAVSGLHVGMVYLGLGFLLRLLPFRNRWWLTAQTLLLLLGVWTFALVTGASPSVMRSATMFSFLIVGRRYFRYTNIYNILAASALFLLCLNPFLIMEAGFQLSYLAVLGIVYFQPKIYRLWYVPYRAGDYLWQLTAVALAAQITTLPVSLFFFNQFPVYFWLSGLIVVPAASLILPLGLVLFLTSFAPPLELVTGQLLHLIIQGVNGLIFRTGQLPFALITGIWLSSGAAILLYLVTGALVAALETRRFGWITAALTGLLLLTANRAHVLWRAHRQQQLVVYHHRGHTLIDLFDGRSVISLSDAPLSERERAFTHQRYQWFRRARQAEQHLLSAAFRTERIQYHPGTLAFGGHRVVIADRPPALPADTLAPVDLFLIRGDPAASLHQLLQGVSPSLVAWDASNRPFHIQRWRRECEEAGLTCYDITQEGALIVSFAAGKLQILSGKSVNHGP